MRLKHKKLALAFVIFMFLTPSALRQSHAALYAFTFEPNRSVLNYSFYVVASDDMFPTLQSRDIVIMRLCGPEEVKEGDIIAINPFLTEASLSRKSTRRLVSVLSESNDNSRVWLIVKGDSILCNEEQISAEQFRGKVTGKIPLVGSILYIKPTTMLLMYLFCWSLALFVVVQLLLRRRRDLRKPVPVAETEISQAE